MNFNSTITSSVSHIFIIYTFFYFLVIIFSDYFTVISFNTLEMKRCGNKLITRRRKCNTLRIKKGKDYVFTHVSNCTISY